MRGPACRRLFAGGVCGCGGRCCGGRCQQPVGATGPAFCVCCPWYRASLRRWSASVWRVLPGHFLSPASLSRARLVTRTAAATGDAAAAAVCWHARLSQSQRRRRLSNCEPPRLVRRWHSFCEGGAGACAAGPAPAAAWRAGVPVSAPGPGPGLRLGLAAPLAAARHARFAARFAWSCWFSCAGLGHALAGRRGLPGHLPGTAAAAAPPPWQAAAPKVGGESGARERLAGDRPCAAARLACACGAVCGGAAHAYRSKPATGV